MYYQLYGLPDEFDTSRFEMLPRTLEVDQEGVCIAKSEGFKGGTIFYTIVQQQSRSPFDPVASALGLGDPYGPSMKRTLLASVVPDSDDILLVCSGRSASMAADRLVDQLASISRPNLPIPPFSPEN